MILDRELQRDTEAAVQVREVSPLKYSQNMPIKIIKSKNPLGKLATMMMIIWYT